MHSGGRTVLTMDTSADMRRLHRAVIENKIEGCRILEAETLAQGRALMCDEAPQLVITEAKMPDGLCYDFCREARQRNISVIFMTGLTSRRHMLAGFGAGCNYYMTKPDYDAEILGAIAEHLLFRKEA